jgi:hypothetical protein
VLGLASPLPLQFGLQIMRPWGMRSTQSSGLGLVFVPLPQLNIQTRYPLLLLLSCHVETHQAHMPAALDDEPDGVQLRV